MSDKMFPEELMGYMSVFDDDDVGDGAWWAMLEDAAYEWNKDHNNNNKKFDPFEAVHAYIRWFNKKEKG